MYCHEHGYLQLELVLQYGLILLCELIADL